MKREIRYAVSIKEANKCLLGLLEYENKIIKADKEKLDYLELHYGKCPICVAVNSNCLGCAAYKPYLDSCRFVKDLWGRYFDAEFNIETLLIKLWEQLVLTREYIWKNWK